MVAHRQHRLPFEDVQESQINVLHERDFVPSFANCSAIKSTPSPLNPFIPSFSGSTSVCGQIAPIRRSSIPALPSCSTYSSGVWLTDELAAPHCRRSRNEVAELQLKV